MKRFWSWFIPTLLIVLFLTMVFAEEPNSFKRRVVILDIPRFDLVDVTPEYSFLNRFIAKSSVGQIAIPTIYYPLTPAQIYLYFNSNNRLKTPRSGYEIYNANELVHGIKAADLYETYTGNKAESGNVVNLDLGKIVAMNQKAVPLQLGSWVDEHKLHTAAIGNADTELPNRLGAALVMDSTGRIDYGAVGRETLLKDARFPSGVRTHPDRIIQYTRSFRTKTNVMVITLGDLERIEAYRTRLTPAQKDYYRRLTLKRYDHLLARLVGTMNDKSTLFVIFTCLQPRKPHIKDNGLTPVLIKGIEFPSGLLYSKSTRKLGHITYTDLRNVIFNYLAETPASESALIRTVPGQWQNIAIEQLGLVINYSFRWPLLKLYAGLLVGLTLLIVLGLILRFGRVTLKILGWGYLYLLTIPATFLVEALINPVKWTDVVIWTLGISGILLVGAAYAGKRNLIRTLGWICLTTVVLILIDGLGNGYCELKSFLGYSAVSGKRYYGIGNEYMGVLMGSYIVFFTLKLIDHNKLQPVVLWSTLALVAIIFFHPYFGADIGGGITVVLGLGVTTCLWLQKTLKFKDIGWLIGALFFGMTFIGVWDMYVNPTATSHFGQLLQAIAEKGFNSFTTIVVRKLEMSWWLISYTPLSLLLIAILILIPIIYNHPPAAAQKFIVRNREMSLGLVGLCITALIGFLFNDSGIVSATMMLVFGLGLLLIVLIEETLSRYHLKS